MGVMWVCGRVNGAPTGHHNKLSLSDTVVICKCSIQGPGATFSRWVSDKRFPTTFKQQFQMRKDSQRRARMYSSEWGELQF